MTRIDPGLETRRYREEVLAEAGKGLDAQGLALLEEDLRSPCTKEIAVFRAFADTVAKGEDGFVVIDTAPTGHTLLLLDAAESCHREVLKQPSGSPEATPIHGAMQLERDLARADIRPFAWIVNQCLAPLAIGDSVLRARRAQEGSYLRKLEAHSRRTVRMPWGAGAS